MAKIRRNQPCPCGSDRKYKHCCLSQELEKARQEPRQATALISAVSWLHRYYADAMDRAFQQQYLSGLHEDRQQKLADLPDALWSMLAFNGREFLLSEGYFQQHEQRIAIKDRVLSADNIPLDATQAAYLERLCSQPLGVYQILEVKPTQGWLVRDVLDKQQTEYRVDEPLMSPWLDVSSYLALRLIPGSAGKISGAIYPFSAASAADLLAQLSLHSDQSVPLRAECGKLIIQAWLQSLTEPLPWYTDPRTGQTGVVVTDQYRVLD